MLGLIKVGWKATSTYMSLSCDRNSCGFRSHLSPRDVFLLEIPPDFDDRTRYGRHRTWYDLYSSSPFLRIDGVKPAFSGWWGLFEWAMYFLDND